MDQRCWALHITVLAVMLMAATSQWEDEYDSDLTTEYDDYILVCDQDPIDLSFVIDASSSIGSQNFSLGLKFIEDFIDMYKIGPDKVRVSTVTFGKGVYPNGTFGFDRYTNKNDTLAAIDSIVWRAGLWTGTGDGINHYTKYQLPAARPGIPHLLIVLTDGNSQEWKKTEIAAREAREKGTKTFAIGVGNRRKVREKELLRIAGDKKRTFRSSSYANLHTVKEKLSFQTCVKKPKPTTPPAAQPCGIEFPTDMQFIYDAASLGVGGNSFVTQFASNTLGQEGLEDGFKIGTGSALCPEDSGLNMGEFPNAVAVAQRMDQLYDSRRLGKIVQQNLVKGLMEDQGARPPSETYKVAVVFVDGKIDDSYLEETLKAANNSVEGGINIFFSDAGESAGLVHSLAQKFGTPPLTGSSLQQSAMLHSALCDTDKR